MNVDPTSDFRIAAAQVPSMRGDVDANIVSHVRAIEAAARCGVSLLVFPELSLTGYEPDLAAELALSPGDRCLETLLAGARRHSMTVVIGAPLQNGTAKPALGVFVVSGDGTVRTYSKMHLGDSEKPYFCPGVTPLTVDAGGHTAGLAICADASQASHPRRYAELGASIYAAGVFLNAEWYVTDRPRLASYAARHHMLVVMANHGASVGTLTSVGKSAGWAPDGRLLAQVAGTETALVVATFDDVDWHAEVVVIK